MQSVTIGLTVLWYILLFSMYGGMIGVIFGTFNYMPANGQWRPMAPAVGATVTLTIMFFLVYVGVAVLRTFAQLSGMRHPKIEAVLLASTAAMMFLTAGCPRRLRPHLSSAAAFVCCVRGAAVRKPTRRGESG